MHFPLRIDIAYENKFGGYEPFDLKILLTVVASYLKLALSLIVEHI